MACVRCILLNQSHDPQPLATGPRLGPSAEPITPLSLGGLIVGFPSQPWPSLPQLEGWVARMIRILLHEEMRWTLQDLDHRFKPTESGSLFQQSSSSGKLIPTTITIATGPAPAWAS